MYYHLTAYLFIEQKVRAPLVARFLMLPVNIAGKSAVM